MAKRPSDGLPLPQRIDAPREPLSTEVSRGLLAYLLTGNLKRGQRIPAERALAEALGVGRSVVREAIKSLALLGVVEVRPGDGTYLKRAESELLSQSLQWGLLLGERRIRDLVETRHHLEIVLADLAAHRRSDSDLSALEDLLGEMRAASNDSKRFVEADVAFHYRIAQAADNESLAQIMAGVQSLLHAWISRVMQSRDSYEPTIREHAAILDAIRRGDSDSARDAMRNHMDAAYQRLERTFPDYDDGRATDDLRLGAP